MELAQRTGPVNGSQSTSKVSNPYAARETIESVIVAFILAFLFRAFVAEAFVIPTGSMAPTLMGAHKDTRCEHCGALYQSTASFEFNREDTNLPGDFVAIGGTCAACRATNAFDLAGNANHATFSGDRILVSKFDYLFRDPKRWDVLVFKYPTDARMNYIKRLVGLPGEYLHIEGGDVYVRKAENEPWALARKPAYKALAMMQVVSDTRYQAADLVEKGWPSLWQPLPKSSDGKPLSANGPTDSVPTDSWKVQQSAEGWTASLPAAASGDAPQWLRYYHRFLDKEEWAELNKKGGDLKDIDPYSTNLVTDFLAYNTTRSCMRDEVYDNTGALRSGIDAENRVLDTIDPGRIRFDGLTGLAQDGLHWVGDLAAEYDIEIGSDQGSLSLDVVEFGIHYTCSIDVATGKATVTATDQGQPVNLFAEGDVKAAAVIPSADTPVRGRGQHKLRFANIDDQLMLWIDGNLIEFDQSLAFDSHKVRTGNARRPYWTAADPLDAAPLAIGGKSLDLTVKRAQVWRDIYYIAVHDSGYSDFESRGLQQIIRGLDNRELSSAFRNDPDGGINVVTWIYANPQLWASTDLFSQRGHLDFKMEEGQFFPMGDNSAASSDARVWGNHSYVERRFLIGKALLVFWPHLWKSPVPHPNFPRMGRIR